MHKLIAFTSPLHYELPAVAFLDLETFIFAFFQYLTCFGRGMNGLNPPCSQAPSNLPFYVTPDSDR